MVSALFRVRFEIGRAPFSVRKIIKIIHSARTISSAFRDPGSSPASPRCAVVRRALFLSGKLFKLTIVLELFRMRFEMPGSRFLFSIVPPSVIPVCLRAGIHSFLNFASRMNQKLKPKPGSRLSPIPGRRREVDPGSKAYRDDGEGAIGA